MSLTEELRVYAACQLLELAIDLTSKDWPADFREMPQKALIDERNRDNARMSILIQAVLKELAPLRGDEE